MICIECEKEFSKIPQLIDIMCLNCSLDINEYILKRFRKLDGSYDMKHQGQAKKLLKRNQALKALKGVVPVYNGAEQLNQICKGCGETFATKASFKDRLQYCIYCQKLKLKLRPSPSTTSSVSGKL